MYEDFKKLTYGASKHKFRLLKDIFDRLSLENLEERMNTLSNIIDHLDTKVQSYQAVITKKRQDDTEHNVNNPDYHKPPTPPTPPPEPPPPSTFLPDLTITGFQPTITSGSATFSITVSNIGTANSSATQLTLVISGVWSVTLPVPGLVVGGSYTTITGFAFDPNGSTESYTVLANVNQAHTVIESNYNNNSTSTPIVIKSLYPVGTLLPDYIISSMTLVTYPNVQTNGENYYHGIWYGEFDPITSQPIDGYIPNAVIDVHNIVMVVTNIGTDTPLFPVYLSLFAIAQITMNPFSNPFILNTPLCEAGWLVPVLAPGFSATVTAHWSGGNANIPGYITFPNSSMSPSAPVTITAEVNPPAQLPIHNRIEESDYSNNTNEIPSFSIDKQIFGISQHSNS